MGETAAAAARRWVDWEEEVVLTDRGRRVVHYYLRSGGGERELAVVGRERSLRHMSYAVPGRFRRSLAAGEPALSPAAAAAEGPPLKWRSRREVVEWLSSYVSDGTYGPFSMTDRFAECSYGNDDADFTDVGASKVVSSTTVVRNISRAFAWLGPAWHCRKQWKHYRSFCRRGITISVHDFVYIMSEENKRLVAYVEDLYEDMNANNRVVVCWFDKIDEVDVQLPSDVDGREIFFSLCLQDLSVECIDGLAAVLSAQHFEKFQNCTKHRYWQPYLCRRQIEYDSVKPFDITQLQGYWSQQLLRTMFTTDSSLKLRFKITKGGSGPDGGQKRKHDSINDDNNPQKCHTSNLPKNVLKHNCQQKLYTGCHVEVLSQDSGIRGCWFRCLIIKRHKDKIKVRYQDLQDADETGNLEEWVLLTRVAAPDQLGIRLSGRFMVRPHHVQQSKSLCLFDVGTIVDAWWHSGWWEGIVMRLENTGRIQVYFPGEKRVAEFGEDELRHSLEWVDNKWNPLKERKDIACQLSTCAEFESKGLTNELVSQEGNLLSRPATQMETLQSNKRSNDKSSGEKIPHDQRQVLADLTNALKFDNLKWRSRKRRRFGSKRPLDTSSGSSSQGDEESSSLSGSFALPNSMPNEEICKIGREPLFIGVPASSLVMSR